MGARRQSGKGAGSGGLGEGGKGGNYHSGCRKSMH